METGEIDELAERYGIAAFYYGASDKVFASRETKRRLLAAMGIAVDDEAAIAESLRQAADHAAPVLRHDGEQRCHLPSSLHEFPAWGITCQLYELRSRRDWGIGDFADLAQLCSIAGRHGADFVGLTPLHALFGADPARCSPFSPSARQFLNPLHIAVDAVPGFAAGDVDAAALETLRARALVDYAGVAAVKLKVLESLFRRWRQAGDGGRDSAFAAFCAAGGEDLERHALFEALSRHMTETGFGAGWPSWPQDYRRPDSDAVAAYARANAEAVEFHKWLQWLADTQLAQAAAAAREAGMRIGLYLDLAVGEAPDGSAVWSRPELYLADINVGAPPDYFSTSGQDWNVRALSPLALERERQRPLVAMIGRAAAHAGALRIDHVMGLWQLFLIPSGLSPAEGAHVRYRIGDALRELGALSQERRLVVVGEDLGYVPEGFREVMERAGILSYRILYFEKEHDGGFRPVEHYPHLSIACLSTHDLPTFIGWWRGDDIALRLDHGLIDAGSANDQRAYRRFERNSLIALLSRHGGVPGEWHEALEDAASSPPDSLVVAVHALLAASSARLAGVRLADLTGETEPTNLPGTSDAYPNWRRRSAVTLEALGEHPLFNRIAAAMTERRPRP